MAVAYAALVFAVFGTIVDRHRKYRVMVLASVVSLAESRWVKGAGSTGESESTRSPTR